MSFDREQSGLLAYRILFFDERGRIAQTLPLSCADDDEALERLARSRHPHALELWQDERLIWRFEDGPLT